MSDRAGYGRVERTLHRIALGNRSVAEMLFDIDQMLQRSTMADVCARRHVFVAGMARAGTTVLMRRLHASGAYRSLTYSDMPFVLAPSIARRLSRGAAPTAAVERAHGDGIAVSTDSPESFEEVFWRVFDGDAYIKADRLLPHQPCGDLMGAYTRYVAAVLASGEGAGRYLSKNNNNTLRLQAIGAAFPEAVILVPFREPLQQAASLLRQHRRFTAMQREDPFVLEYMNWLGHHEFGAGHLPFAADHAVRAPWGDRDCLDYWLDGWTRTYGWVLASAPEQVHAVSYEALCTDPAAWHRVEEIASVPASEDAEPFALPEAAPVQPVDPALLHRAQCVHRALLERAAA